MNMKYRYYHQLYELDGDSIVKKLGIIAGKKNLKKFAVKYYFEDTKENRPDIGFTLIDSPNKTLYEICPCISYKGNPFMRFRAIEEIELEKGFDW